MRSPGLALVLPLFLGGCAIPPAVTVATLVLDGVSYVTTGKSTTDHAISAVAKEDCALHRVIDDEDICDPDGEVLIALEGADSADENWYLDPETASLGPDATTGRGAADELATTAAPAAQDLAVEPKTLGATATATPALTPDPVGGGNFQSSQATAIAVTAQPAPRSVLVHAQPVPKPHRLQLTQQTIRRFTQPAQQDDAITTYTVIGSFQYVENANRMVQTQGDRAVIQTFEVNGTTTHRVLVDQPVEQARHDGFPDAWPVRLCATDLGVPPCGYYVVSQAGVYLETGAN